MEAADGQSAHPVVARWWVFVGLLPGVVVLCRGRVGHVGFDGWAGL